MSDAMEDIGARGPAAPRLSLWQFLALVALAKAAGTGWAARPGRTQRGTLFALARFGLVKSGLQPRGARRSRATLRKTGEVWALTPAGRALLAAQDIAAPHTKGTAA